MPAQENSITAADVCAALDQEFVTTFHQDYDQLADALGLFDVEIITAGTALYQYKVTGQLAASAAAEGEAAALSHYKLDKDPIGDLSPKRYDKLTTAEAILKSGYENAVMRTDRKFRNQLRDLALTQFYAFLAAGTGKASGTSANLQMALAMADGTLGTAMETNQDSGGTLVHWVNRMDAATYLGNADVTTQTSFGLTYLESFLGVENVILTSRQKAGTVAVTPVENVHPYGLDFAALSDGGLEYETDDYGIIGVAHRPDYDHGSVKTHAMLGLALVPEITDYIVSATFKAA